jgi:RNA polymerase-binding transcription factor
MQKRDVLLRRHKTLLARWTDLHERLADEMANLHDFTASDYTGDSADVAFDTNSDELASRLADLDARELNQIERALACLKQGTYGLCEGGSENCQKRIPVSRLNALPYTTLCINCEREMEKNSIWIDRRGAGNWAQVFDSEARLEPQRIKLSEWEF